MQNGHSVCTDAFLAPNQDAFVNVKGKYKVTHSKGRCVVAVRLSGV